MIPTETLSREVFTEGMIELGGCLGVSYSARDENGALTGDTVKARKLYEILKERGWSASQFRARLNDFIGGNPFKGWSPADFLNDQGAAVEPIALHPYSWYLEQCDKGKGGEATCYVAPDGRRGWGWIHELDHVLERDQPKVETPALPEAEEPVEIANADDWLRGRAALDRELKVMAQRDQIQDLERRVDEQSVRISRYETRMAKDDEIIGALQKKLNQLLIGEITVEQYREQIEGRG